MKIDKSLQLFTEKYNKDMIISISELSNDRSLSITDTKISLFNLKESFDNFIKYLEGYGKYKIKFKDSNQASPQNVIKESVNKFINNDLFKEEDYRYDNVDKFVMEYCNGIKRLTETVDKIKSLMVMGGVKLEYVGDINEFTDTFIDNLDHRFDEGMDKLLWASGYKSQEKFKNIKKMDPIIFI